MGQTNEPIIVKKTPFINSRVVVCNDCHGRDENCTTCMGKGILNRVAEGTITLTLIK